ncbi:MAG: 2-oxoacid:acceptor oxidoreductase family protein, partial [Desulfuromusa sp.]|nr:2-oxoacid:acceptor oxidoreductase family protein [Desulfuromusa sp.]
ISPPEVARGVESYPENLAQKICQKFPESVVVDGLNLALAAGNAKTVNTVLLGVLSNILEFKRELWLTALQKMIPERLLDVNLKAFEAGCQVK